MNTEDKSQMPLISPEDEKEAQEELARLRKRLRENEKSAFKTTNSWTGFKGKSSWDWLQLLGVLAIPLILGIATLLFGIQQAHLADLQHQSDQRLAQQQHDADQQSALDQQRATILQTYLDNIQDLLLNRNLLKSKPNDAVAILTRARTLTALRGLDPVRKGYLLTFLYDVKLIGFFDAGKIYDPVINLYAADLSGADLSGAYTGIGYGTAKFGSVEVSTPVYSYANLEGADLSGANLSGAHLRFADLIFANLSGADLIFADLSGAHLRFAGGITVDSSGANLYKANLSGANLSNANLSNAINLTQQQLDQVYSCANATLPQGLTCHHNP